jgi:putative ABC transport system ATP-binding protein
MIPLVAVINLTKSYAGPAEPVAALREVTVSIQPGEFVALIGPSGSGKSTLMNLIGLLDTPTAGQYYLAGHDVSRLSRRALALVRNRSIGFVFQGFHLLPRLTARENVELPLVYAGVGRRERRRRAAEMLQRMGLAERCHHRPNQLSGGQQQRVAIARALIHRPPLLLADEPTGNLDSATGVEVMAELTRLHHEGQTIILVTHDPQVARTAERTITLRDGRIVSDQSTATRHSYAA